MQNKFKSKATGEGNYVAAVATKAARVWLHSTNGEAA